MRKNTIDIMAATNCNENQAFEIELRINDDWLLDWSECEMSELHKVAQRIHNELTEADHYRFPKTYNS